MLTTVATGGPQIAMVDGQYQQRRDEIALGLKRLGIENPFPWRSLWDWHGKWSSGEFPSYASRRRYIREIAEPAELELERRRSQGSVTDWGSRGTTWGSLEERLTGLKTELDRAAGLDDLQDVGRRAREIIIDAAAFVFQESMTPANEEPPKKGDAKQQIEFFLSDAAGGTAHVELRRLIRATWDLANAVTHSSSATRIDAFAAAQATVVLVRCLQEIHREAQ